MVKKRSRTTPEQVMRMHLLFYFCLFSRIGPECVQLAEGRSNPGYTWEHLRRVQSTSVQSCLTWAQV